MNHLGRLSNCGMEATIPTPVFMTDMVNQSGTLAWSLFLNTQILAATINRSELAHKVPIFTIPGLGNGKLESRKQEAIWEMGGSVGFGTNG